MRSPSLLQHLFTYTLSTSFLYHGKRQIKTSLVGFGASMGCGGVIRALRRNFDTQNKGLTKKLHIASSFEHPVQLSILWSPSTEPIGPFLAAYILWAFARMSQEKPEAEPPSSRPYFGLFHHEKVEAVKTLGIDRVAFCAPYLSACSVGQGDGSQKPKENDVEGGDCPPGDIGGIHWDIGWWETWWIMNP